MMHRSELDTICDLLLNEDLRISYVSPAPNPTTLPDFMTHPRTIVGDLFEVVPALTKAVQQAKG